MELNIRLTVLVVETARLERRGVNDSYFAFNWSPLHLVKVCLSQGTLTEGGWFSTIDLRVQTSLDIVNIIYFCTEHATLMRRSNVLSLLLQSVFPA